MINSKLGNNILLFFIAIFFFLTASFFHYQHKPTHFDIDMQDRALNINKEFLKIISFGNKRTFSSILWIQTLMESDNSHYQGDDRKNWMYLRFDTIASMDPRFYENYLWGGMYLSIIKNDMRSASEIFDKGLIYYPDDYELNFRQGFNHYFELGEFEEGLKYLDKISEHPKTPTSIKLIINKLRFETSANYDFALNFLHRSILQQKDEVLLKKLRSDFYALKAERDLNCLNDVQKNCDRFDALGRSYIFKNGKWKTEIPYRPYRIYIPKK